MLDRMYCVNCKKTFPDYMETRAREKTITVGQFMYNQQRVMWDEPIEFTGNKRTFQVSCPYCNSINTVNATEIIEIYEPFIKNKKNNNLQNSSLYLEQRYGKIYRAIVKASATTFKYDERHN